MHRIQEMGLDGDTERVAKAIAKDRMRRVMLEAVPSIFDTKVARDTFDESFDLRWNGDTEVDIRQRAKYRADAAVAIAEIKAIERESVH